MTKEGRRGKAACKQHGHETYTAPFALYTCTRLASSSMVASFFGLLRKKRSMVSRVTSATATHRRAVKDRMEHGNVLNSTRFEFLSFGPCPASLAAGTLIAEESLTACLQTQNRWPGLSSSSCCFSCENSSLPGCVLASGAGLCASCSPIELQNATGSLSEDSLAQKLARITFETDPAGSYAS